LFKKTCYIQTRAKIEVKKETKRIYEETHNAPEYLVGKGDTIDLVILLIRVCISCQRNNKSRIY